MRRAVDWTQRIGRRIKLRDLHVFLAVAQAGSMGRAAAALAVSQPVVSKAVAQLEHALGKPLLDRGSQGVEPTAYGRALIDASVAVFDELRRAVSVLDQLADPTGGHIRIGCTEPGAAGFVPTVVDRVSRLHAKATCHVLTADATSLIERELRGRAIEIAVGAIPTPADDKDLQVEMLFEDRAAIMAGAASRWVRRRRIALDELMDERWILPESASPAGRAVAEAFRSVGLDLPRRHLMTLSIPFTQHLLATGSYLAIMPVTMARISRTTPLRVLNVEFAAAPRTVVMVTLANRTLSPLARTFMAHARDTARTWSRWIDATPSPRAGSRATPPSSADRRSR
jgi:DNA-binding transcriptional LysR family regulator